MSYPPPPGAASSSLPPRPPPSKVSGFKPAFPAASAHTPSPGAVSSPYSAPPSYSSAPSYPGAPSSQYGPSTSSYGTYAQPGQVNNYQQQKPYSQYSQQSQSYGQQTYYGAPAEPSSGAAPQIRNPFPAPSQGGGGGGGSDYDPEMAAQIAQWQSAYVKDPSKDSATPGRPGAAGASGASSTTYSADPIKNTTDPSAAGTAASAAGGDKKKTVVRSGGGQKWTDDTLLEWDPSHLRLFVGNLAGETTDESLHKAFSRWKSLQKARVIRDKVTSKSKGYGFVSFSDPDEFFSAAKEMNGKYIQSHPVVVRKSTTEIKPQASRDRHHGGGGKWGKNNKNKHRGGNGGGAGGQREDNFEPSLGPSGGGVHKPGQKTRNGLKILG